MEKIEPVKLKHSKEEVLEAAKFLYTFSSDQKYVDNLQILITYLEDITNSMLQYKQSAEKSTQMIKILDRAMKTLPQDHKPKRK